MNCKYCNRLCKNKNSFVNHERLCKQNPNRQKTWVEQQYENGKSHFVRDDAYREKQRQIRLSQPPIDQETRKKISQGMKKYYSDPLNRKKQSEIMKAAVEQNPESYSDKNIVGRSKHFTVDGVRYNSTWEYIVAKFLDENNFKWKRTNLIPERYFWNNSWHLYFPDFLLEDLDCYIEVKGYETDRDRAKWKYSTKKVLVIKAKDIEAIKKGKYVLMEDKH